MTENNNTPELEIWKSVIDNDRYIVSSFGRVVSLMHKGNPRKTPKILTWNYSTSGYPVVCLRYGKISKATEVHRIVMRSFYGYKPGFHINHIDGIRKNSVLSNLEYCTARYNAQHRDRNTKYLLGAYKVGKRFKATYTIKGKGFYIGTYDTELEAHQAYMNKINKIIHTIQMPVKD